MSVNSPAIAKGERDVAHRLYNGAGRGEATECWNLAILRAIAYVILHRMASDGLQVIVRRKCVLCKPPGSDSEVRTLSRLRNDEFQPENIISPHLSIVDASRKVYT
jgi:hypothetical protein